MKTHKYKKTWLFVAVAAVAVIGGLLTFGMRALAAAPTVTVGSDFKFLDAYHIQGTIDGSSITFFDKDPTDSTRNFAPDAAGTSALNSAGLFQGKINNWGVNLNSKVSSTSVKASLAFGYASVQGNNTTYITVPTQNYSPSDIVSISNPSSAASSYYRWDGSGNIIKGDSSQTFQSTNVFNVFINQTNNGTCEASGIMVVGASGNTGALYSLVGVSRGGPTQNAIPDSISKYLQNPGSCQLASSPSTADIAGTPPVAVTSSGNITCDPSTDSSCHCDTVGGQKFCSSNNSQGSGSTTVTGSDRCVDASGGFSLTWLLCPTLAAADAFANTTTGLFEKLLSFRVSDLSNNNGVERVKTSWSLIRDIASALLVVVMLVMVVSQATGSGPFEAYTVRKLLPKLVVAVILMQISWSLLGYIVNLVDDVGHGLKDILYLPFRPGNLDDFGALLANAHVGTFAAGTFSWVALLGVGIGVAIALPTILMFAFIAIVADLTGLAVLVFRKILILMALILAPLALLAWILPGTQTYFKLWYSNFLKALMMYPLVVAIIAAGRIFAYVVGTTGEGTFLNFFLVMVGFFGPLFILPKTFKWGGQAMQAVGNSAFKVTSKLEERPKKYFQNRQEDWSKYRRGLSEQRYAAGEGFNPRRFWRRPLDLARAGQLDPLRYGEMRTEASQSYIKQGEEERASKIAGAEAELVRKRQRVRAAGGNHDAYLQATAQGWAPAIDDEGNVIMEDEVDEQGNPVLDEGGNAVQVPKKSNDYDWIDDKGDRQSERVNYDDHWTTLAALNQVSKLGAGTNWRYLEHLYDESRAGRSVHGLAPDEIRKFFDDNVETVRARLPHVYTGRTNVADSSPEAFAQMHGVEIESELNYLLGQIRTGTPQQRSDATTQLQMFSTSFRAALQDPTIRGKIENGGLRAFKSLVDDNPDLMTAANNERARMGLPTFDFKVDPGSVRAALGSDLANDINSSLQERGGVVSVSQTGSLPDQSSPPAQQAATATAQAGQTQSTAISSGEGQIIVQHQEPRMVQLQAGEAISPGGVILSPRAQEEMSTQFELMHRELRNLRRLGVRNQQQQNRLEEIQANHPEWQNEQGENT